MILGGYQIARALPRAFVEIVAATYRNVHLLCLVSSTEEILDARQLLADARIPQDAVSFICIRLDSAWARDYGPMFVRRTDGSTVVLDLGYTGRPGKEYRPFDGKVPAKLARLMGVPLVRLPLGTPGGNLLSNGDGLYVSTAAVAAKPVPTGSPVKVPPVAETQILLDSVAAKAGARKWLAVEALKREPTGDIDMFLTFVAPDVAVVGRLDPAAEPENAAILDRTAAKLAAVQTSRGRMKVHRIPMPAPRNGRWRSYNNVVFANGVLLMPNFSDDYPKLRQEALALYAQLLPGWRIVGVRVDELEVVDGYLHCLTRNLPWFVPPPVESQPASQPDYSAG